MEMLYVKCKLSCLAVFLLLAPVCVFADTDTSSVKLILPEVKTVQIGKINKKLERTRRRLQVNAAATLKRMQKAEQKILKQLQRTGKSGSEGMTSIDSVYKKQLHKIHSFSGNTASIKDYFPSLDSLQTGFAFIKKIDKALPADQLKSVQSLSETIAGIQNQLNISGQLQTFFSERKSSLREYTQNLSIVREWKNFNKELYYYQQQVREYKALINHPDQLASKMIAVLREQPAFRDFMANNSQLAQLFRLPGQSTNTSPGTAVAGLQTRASVSQLLQQQFPTQGMQDPGIFFQQQVGVAKAEMNQWKEKLNQLGGGSSDLDMPDFKPNGQRTKTFLQRLEWGLNIQSQRPNGLLPVTSEFAFMVGYKLNDKSTIGLGTAYKMGWGKNFNAIRITHQGVGLRSFLDIKLKGSFWITGGYELNHQQEFNRIDELKDLNAWQRSGLVGLTRKYNIGKRRGNLQLLWDFLSYSQMPRTQALKFRIGYTF